MSIALSPVLAAEAQVTGFPALLIILVILAIPVALGIFIGKAVSRRKQEG